MHSDLHKTSRLSRVNLIGIPAVLGFVAMVFSYHNSDRLSVLPDIFYDNPPPSLNKGMADLSLWDISENPAIRLSGEWEIRDGIHSPEEFSSDPSAAEISTIPRFNRNPDPVSRQWENFLGNDWGSFTTRVRIRAGRLNRGKILSVYAHNIMNNYRIYFDGRLIFSNVSTENLADSNSPRFMIEPVRVNMERDEHELLVQVENHLTHPGGIYDLWIGDNNAILSHIGRIQGFSGVLAGIMMAAAILLTFCLNIFRGIGGNGSFLLTSFVTSLCILSVYPHRSFVPLPYLLTGTNDAYISLKLGIFLLICLCGCYVYLCTRMFDRKIVWMYAWLGSVPVASVMCSVASPYWFLVFYKAWLCTVPLMLPVISYRIIQLADKGRLKEKVRRDRPFFVFVEVFFGVVAYVCAIEQASGTWLSPIYVVLAGIGYYYAFEAVSREEWNEEIKASVLGSHKEAAGIYRLIALDSPADSGAFDVHTFSEVSGSYARVLRLVAESSDRQRTYFILGHLDRDPLNASYDLGKMLGGLQMKISGRSEPESTGPQMLRELAVICDNYIKGLNDWSGSRYRLSFLAAVTDAGSGLIYYLDAGGNPFFTAARESAGTPAPSPLTGVTSHTGRNITDPLSGDGVIPNVESAAFRDDDILMLASGSILRIRNSGGEQLDRKCLKDSFKWARPKPGAVMTAARASVLRHYRDNTASALPDDDYVIIVAGRKKTREALAS